MSSPQRPPVLSPSADALDRAGRVIRAGGLVAFPTETVYGLGADATDDRAVAAIFAAKGRPTFNPLIVHLADGAEVGAIVTPDDRARILIDRFWPGPLTLVLPRPGDSPVSLLVSAGLDTVAVRCPDHPTARALIRAAGRPIAAPSANRSGSVSPTAAEHVVAGLGDRVDLVLDDGACAVGLESTVLDLSVPVPVLLRPGAVLREEMEPLIGPIRSGHDDPTAPKSPGQLLSHYAPGAAVRLNATDAGPDEAFLAFGPDRSTATERLNLSPAGDLREAAANLFAHLRRLDARGVRAIAVAPIPDRGLGAAINDRLRRAAAPRGNAE